MRMWLLVDGNFMAHRARHSTGSLSHEGMATGVSFGVLRDLESVAETFRADVAVIAFDHRSAGLRLGISPTYKSKRKEGRTPEKMAEDVIFYEELDRLKQEWLPLAGYRNVIEVQGYEADDILAQYARDLPENDQAVIVSADGDLLQCLSADVKMYNPITKKTTTKQTFRDQWGIYPSQWAKVKALAGCESDSVVGLPGIGDKTAAAWVGGTLEPPKGKRKSATKSKYDTISEGLCILEKNLPLVTLPFPGLVLPDVVPDKITGDSKIAVQVALGIRAPSRSQRAIDKAKAIVMASGDDAGFDINIPERVSR